MKTFKIIASINFVKELSKLNSDESYIRIETSNLAYKLDDTFVTVKDLGLTIDRKLDVFNVNDYSINKDKLKVNRMVELEILEGIQGQTYTNNEDEVKNFKENRFFIRSIKVLNGLELITLHEVGLLSEYKLNYLLKLEELELRNDALRTSLV